jgi:hypothetical protein
MKITGSDITSHQRSALAEGICPKCSGDLEPPMVSHPNPRFITIASGRCNSCLLIWSLRMAKDKETLVSLGCRPDPKVAR